MKKETPMRSVFALPLVVAAATACGGGNSNVDAHPTIDSPPTIDGPPQIDGAVDGAPFDGPPIDATDPRFGDFDLAGGANGILWDTATSTLYLTDSNANTLLMWTDAGGFQTHGTWPTTTAGISLGDLVLRSGGAVLTTNFGFNTEGTVFKMQPD